ncbi:MAG: hypothetical protein M0027_05185 [Candidatus Dormibacteraeota bacterium]|nr:hypothetical protein [Candidatus Dormibacteraeota bacterium]
MDLDRWVHPARLQVTDIDVLGIEFGQDLSTLRTVIECKTGDAKSAPKEIDLMLRQVGLKALAQADRAVLVVARRVSPKARELGTELGVLLQDADDLDRRESLLGIDRASSWGSHDPTYARFEQQMPRQLKADPDLTRVYWLLRSECWNSAPALSLKRLMSAIELLGRRWNAETTGPMRRTVSWLTGDAIVAFSVAAVQLAALAVRLPPSEFRRQVAFRLAEGGASIGEMERLSKAVDTYIAGVLGAAGVAPAVSVAALGAFQPTPPGYTDSLLEVLERLAQQSRRARVLPLYLDIVVAQRVKGRDWRLPDLSLWGIEDADETAMSGRLVLAFLKGHAGLPEDFANVLDARPAAASRRALEISRAVRSGPEQLQLATVGKSGEAQLLGESSRATEPSQSATDREV